MDERKLIYADDAIRWIKIECNPYGKPTLDFKSGKKVIEYLERLPSAELEIIRCKNCRNNHWCNIQEAAMAGDNFFCGAAERRIDG